MNTRKQALVLLLFAGFLAGCGTSRKVAADNPENAPHVAVVKVARQNLSSTLEIASEFQPYQEINVYAKVSGYIQKLYINWGTRVREGQLLAELEVPELKEQLEHDEASVAQAAEDLNRAQSAYSVAHVTYTRLASVQKSRPELVSQQDIDVAQGKDLEASAEVSAAQQALLAAKAALEKDRAIYSYARITAPFDGVVTEIDAYTGALLPAGTSSNKGDQALCHLSQINLLRLVIPLPERAVADVHIGETVAVNVSTTHQTFNGKIVRTSDQIDTDTRTMHTEIDVPNPEYALVPGMYATVRIPLHTVQNVLTVPVQAVEASGGDQGTVLVVDNKNRVQRRDVTLGVQSATDAEVVSGLAEGETVVYGEQSQYKPGELVAPKIVTPSELEKE